MSSPAKPTVSRGREHWCIFDALDIGTCPRCTYQPHNQIYEHVILRDSMKYKFI